MEQNNTKKSQYERYIEDCPTEIKSFLQYLTVIQGRSLNTVKIYYYNIKDFFIYILSQKEEFSNINSLDIKDKIKIFNEHTNLDLIKSITEEDVLEFLYYIQKENNNGAKTRSARLTALKTFYKYLNRKGILQDYNPVIQIDSPKKPKTVPKYLTLEESQTLLKSVNTSCQERDFCIITLLLNCGMRLSELVNINCKDIKDNTIKLFGKGAKERIIYLNQACVDALAAYLDVRLNYEVVIDRDALFISDRTGKRLSPRRVEQIVGKALDDAGLGGMGYSPHKLRHTAATLMYQAGVDVRTLKEILGHENLSTTQIYTHLNNEQIKDAIDTNPLASYKKE